MSNGKADIYTKVTNRIIEQLEQGVRPWLKPWNAEPAAGRISRPLRHNSLPYRGINVLMLWAEAESRGYACPLWLTYKQATELGGQVRKGEHSALVVYADRMNRTETNDAGEEVAKAIPFLKSYCVFNAEQIDGLPAQYTATAAPILDPVQRIDAAERFFANTGATLNHGGNQAFYAVHQDRIQLPPFVSFRDPESYYATLAHETTHWTRHPSRLDREFGRKRFGDAGYATEELVAELGSAFLAADLGLTIEPRDDHAGYIANWLEVLKNDRRAIFTAAAHAERAVGYLHGLQPNAQPITEEAA